MCLFGSHHSIVEEFGKILRYTLVYSAYCQNALSFSKKCVFLGRIVPAGLLISWFSFPNCCSSSLMILFSAGYTECCWKSSLLWKGMCWPVFLVDRCTLAKMTNSKFSTSVFFSRRRQWAVCCNKLFCFAHTYGHNPCSKSLSTLF